MADSQIYEASNTLLGSIMTSGRVQDEKLAEYLREWRSAKWLLGDEMDQYLDQQIYNKTLDLQTLQAEIGDETPSDERTKNIQRQRELKNELHAQIAELRRRFDPFLPLRH